MVLLESVARDDAWFQCVERLLLSVLEEELAPEEFGKAVADVGPPHSLVSALKSVRKTSAVHCAFSDVSRLRDALYRVGSFLLQNSERPISIERQLF